MALDAMEFAQIEIEQDLGGSPQQEDQNDVGGDGGDGGAGGDGGDGGAGGDGGDGGDDEETESCYIECIHDARDDGEACLELPTQEEIRKCREDLIENVQECNW